MGAESAHPYGLAPDAAVTNRELDGLAASDLGDLAGLDRRVLAETKALIDLATLPADADLVTAYETFFASAARLAVPVSDVDRAPTAH